MDDTHTSQSSPGRLDDPPSTRQSAAESRSHEQDDSQLTARNALASSHSYPVIHLGGNAQAIFGNVGSSASTFFRNEGDEVSRRLLLNALYFEGIQSRRNQIAARAGSPKYIEWVWTTSFNTWLQSPDPFYWITGCPGSGKSTLMKHISESQKTISALKASGQDWMTVHFFFDFRASQGTANQISGMLRSLLIQIVQRLPEVVKHMDSARFNQCWDESSLHDYMDAVCDALQSTSTKICAFVDGLDEFDGLGSDLLETLHNLEDRSGIKICVASRPYPVFQDNLSEYQHLVMQDHNHQSIDLYTEAQFKSNRIVDVAGLPRHLSDRIRVKARGIFLWARLATDQLLRDLLAGKSTAELEAALEQMPSEVEAMYQVILDRLPKVLKLEAALLLYILTVSRPKIELRKLFVAMSVLASRISKLDQIQSVDVDGDNKSRLLALLGDFVDVSRIRLYSGSDGFVLRWIPFTFGEAGLEHRSRSTVISSVALTHETLHTYLKQNVWLKAIIGSHFAAWEESHFWFDLYRDELFDCVGRCPDLPPEALQRYQSFVVKLRRPDRGRRGRRLHENRIQIDVGEVLELLGLWKAWTPLLPYALSEVFERHICDVETPPGRFDDLHRVVQSPAFWLHRIICTSTVLLRAENRPLCLLDPRTHSYAVHMLFDLPGNIQVSNHDAFIAICHGAPAYLSHTLREGQSSMSPNVKNSIFEFTWSRHLDYPHEDWKAPLQTLVKTGCSFNGNHLCDLLVTAGEYYANEIKPFHLELLCHVDVLLLLSEHSRSCGFYKSPTSEAGFLSHWAELHSFDRSGDERLTGLFNALSIKSEHLNQIVEPIGEPLLNTILNAAVVHLHVFSHGYRENTSTLKIVLALQAGADPHIVGKSGTAFDTAAALLRRLQGKELVTAKWGLNFDRRGKLMLKNQIQKITQLLEYHASHNGELPQDLDPYLKFSDDHTQDK